MVLAFDIYFISFINEFKQVTIDYPNVRKLVIFLQTVLNENFF